ncbi:hypothetical protein H113_07860 [Trichophyton rubrum MR1459]|uniref:Uncharacterized protein n=1 Tax=Trichophyton rubrum (strain ATCC MYA-4607 / CBS 118892) TaxID=559305 RepID=A0A080WPV0_TRIRC|nr:uncharacterized protein TERG_11557 [Trichophyton rubrum CBS 118892]EZF91145.1 hypothetical protein H113_07860 [Trichophyton rubrum MR1459]EZG02045.1 hypothetical protein H106_07638 [Trichophyton rubrum CBS 735.88]KFL60218.1 hypothetical protein TERG_11557 [Trichophyton rubrum CBS 118892]
MASAYMDQTMSLAAPAPPRCNKENNALHKRDCQQRTSGSIAAARGRKKVGERVCLFLLSEAASPCCGWSCAETLSSLAFAPDIVDRDGSQNKKKAKMQNGGERERRKAGEPFIYSVSLPVGR